MIDFVWKDACCVCKWPIWTSMTGEGPNGHECFCVGYDGSESHPWCAPYRTSDMLSRGAA